MSELRDVNPRGEAPQMPSLFLIVLKAAERDAAFSGGGVASAPVEGATFLQFAGPGLEKLSEQ